jgi:uroporphyrin-III C-methyltransferase / precorrin-2 dehydrogenase / sirohydrochlorin ferrochelatase
MLAALPLFHRLDGRVVAVLGMGEAAAAKRRLVQRAGGTVVDNLAQAIAQGARLAFVAHEDEALGLRDAAAARAAGLLVNVVDRPALCDFTTPSLIDRAPVLIAVGTGGASAGLAKALRLRLETLLPGRLGALAEALYAARAALRARWPDAGDRRRALDGALDAGGALDPFAEQDDGAVARWIDRAALPRAERHVLHLTGPDPDDLTLRAARLLGRADALVIAPGVPDAILARARADAVRLNPGDAEPAGLVVEIVPPPR